ncbi:MAG: hypothetical protein JRN11_07455 [Nitrososphaerota archaeon]|nr:hypothetical protein [Nitrososphaerota archaeon]MDG7014323.1 hypothetical protein [Nitrososphaerota archaeon]MDG7026567.1 hypothetical protein [Nitrososphaerota archaeon]
MATTLGPPRASVTAQVSVIAVSAALFALAKGITAYIRTPWGVGQLFIASFIPVYFAVTSDAIPAALGAGIGSFLGDLFFLVPLGATTPFFALTVGAPANFVATLLLAVFVKKYRSWSSFVAATVCFLTLGNFTAGALLWWLAPLPSVSLILGFTVYWDMTAIPAVLIGVPALVRATSPIIGRSKMLRYVPDWSGVGRRQMAWSLVFSLVFVGFGGAIFLLAPSTLSGWPGLATYFAIAGVAVVIFGPLASLLTGKGLGATRTAA